MYNNAGAGRISNLEKPSVINLPFKPDLINDALKSLVLNDPASANPSVCYQSPQTLLQTLRSLKVDLSGNTNMAGILGKLRGAEAEVSLPAIFSGSQLNHIPIINIPAVR